MKLRLESGEYIYVHLRYLLWVDIARRALHVVNGEHFIIDDASLKKVIYWFDPLKENEPCR